VMASGRRYFHSLVTVPAVGVGFNQKFQVAVCSTDRIVAPSAGRAPSNIGILILCLISSWTRLHSGEIWKLRGLEITKSRNHEITKSRNHEITKSRNHEITQRPVFQREALDDCLVQAQRAFGVASPTASRADTTTPLP